MIGRSRDEWHPTSNVTEPASFEAMNRPQMRPPASSALTLASTSPAVSIASATLTSREDCAAALSYSKVTFVGRPWGFNTARKTHSVPSNVEVSSDAARIVGGVDVAGEAGTALGFGDSQATISDATVSKARAVRIVRDGKGGGAVASLLTFVHVASPDSFESRTSLVRLTRSRW